MAGPLTTARPKTWRRVAVLVAVVAGVLIAPSAAGAQADQGAGCDNRTNNTVAKMLACADVPGASKHLDAFQAIADANDGTRASGTPGYDASVDYVAKKAESWGYDVTVQDFEFRYFEELSPATLANETDGAEYVPQEDFFTLQYSGSGDATAVAQGVDLMLPPGDEPNSSTSGCEPEDFAGFTAGNIALIQRGACNFSDKALNAEAAGAVGVVIFNEGQEGRTDAFGGTLGDAVVNIPVVGTSFDIGTEMDGDTVHLATDTLIETRTTYNVLAETKSGNDGNVVMVGAHLDSVTEGPGINDNGSGSAALLEVAHAMRKVRPNNTVRFAWWGAEESGLLGSTHYVETLPADQLESIALYLNFDMVASPNYVRFIYDGDGSEFDLPGPEGSAAIEKLYETYYGFLGLESEPTEISFRSDYAAFFDADIPFGGLFTGAEGIKTPEQEATYGGTAGEQYDQCYHQACDTRENINEEVFRVNIGGIAVSTLLYSFSTESVNGT